MTEATSAVGTAGGAETGGRGKAIAGRTREVFTVLRRRLPFTSTIVLVMLALAVGTGSLWGAAQDKPWYPYVAYGLPSMESGHWWALLSGPLLAVVPLYYLPMIGSFALFAGFAEWRLGTRRAAAVTVGWQLLSVVVAVQFLALSRSSGWAWAERMSVTLDVGFSGGALAAVAVASATMRSPWRLRLRAGLCLYAGVAIVYVGTLADLVHFFALALALPLGNRLVGRHRAPSVGRPSLREWRLLAVAGLLTVTVAEVVMLLIPGNGPFGSASDLGITGPEVLVLCVIAAPMINGLRRGSRTAWRWAVGLTVFAMAQVTLVGMVLALGEFVGEEIDTAGMPLFFVDNLLWMVLLVLLIAARGAFRVPSRRRSRRRGGPGPEVAKALLAQHGGSTLSWMATWPQNSYFLTADGQSCIAYRRHAGTAIALGDPIAPPGAAAAAVAEFIAMCENSGLVPCFFSATATTVAGTSERGWQQVQVAEDTLVDLENLEFRGKAWQDVRSSLNKAKKDGIEFRLVRLSEQPRSVVSQVRTISEEWIGDKGMPEMGFTLGGVDEALAPETRVGLAIDADGVVHGVTSWMPVHCGADRVGGWTLDVMRRRADGFRPVMEFLIASSCLAFRDEGAEFVSLSGAPLARSATGEPANAVDRVLNSLGTMMEPYYGFRSLHAFKTKFQPRHEPMYLAFRDEADLPRIGIALGRAYLPNTSLLELAKFAKAGKRRAPAQPRARKAPPVRSNPPLIERRERTSAGI